MPGKPASPKSVRSSFATSESRKPIASPRGVTTSVFPSSRARNTL